MHISFFQKKSLDIKVKNYFKTRKNNQKTLEMPAWMSGDVKNLNKFEESVSDEESTKRIIIILLIFSSFLISIATSFTAICMKLSISPSAKKEWMVPDIGRKKTVNPILISLRENLYSKIARN